MRRIFLTLSSAVVTAVGLNCLWLPDPPTPTLPADWSVGVPTEPTFSSTAVNDSMLTAPFLQITGLFSGATYFWRVRATNSFGTSDWSSVWSFIPGGL